MRHSDEGHFSLPALADFGGGANGSPPLSSRNLITRTFPLTPSSWPPLRRPSREI